MTRTVGRRRNSYAPWTIKAGRRPQADWETPLTPYRVDGETFATIEDPERDLVCEVGVVDGRIRSITVTALGDTELTQQVLGGLPIGYLVEAVEGVGWQQGGKLAAATALGTLLKQSQPPVKGIDRFMAVWPTVANRLETDREGRVTRRVTRRQAAAELLGMSKSGVDQLLRQARQRGLVEPSGYQGPTVERETALDRFVIVWEQVAGQDRADDDPTPRQQAAAVLGVTVGHVDRLLRQARQAGRIPPAAGRDRGEDDDQGRAAQ